MLLHLRRVTETCHSGWCIDSVLDCMVPSFRCEFNGIGVDFAPLGTKHPHMRSEATETAVSRRMKPV